MHFPKIVKAGVEILNRVSDPIVEFNCKPLEDLSDMLLSAMYHYQGVGLAAPQVGIAQRIFVYGIKKNVRYPDAQPIDDTILINPELIETSEEESSYDEGCLSIPNIKASVSRPNEITLKARNVDGGFINRTVSGLEARIILHELDHLNGLLFLSRVKDMSTLKYVEP